jgi:hypothetical protein
MRRRANAPPVRPWQLQGASLASLAGWDGESSGSSRTSGIDPKRTVKRKAATNWTKECLVRSKRGGSRSETVSTGQPGVLAALPRQWP